MSKARRKAKTKNLIMVTLSDELRKMFDSIKDEHIDKDVDVVRRLIKREYERKQNKGKA